MNKNTNKIPVVFAINNEYVKQCSTVIVSIIKNSSNDTAFEFNILNKNLTDNNKNEIKKLIKYNKNIIFNFIDINEKIQNYNINKYLQKDNDGCVSHVTEETFFRLFIPKIFKDYEKILYLDSDVLCLGNIKELYNQNIKEYYAGVVTDLMVEDYIKYSELKETAKQYIKDKLHKTNENYFNAGVILFNIKKIRQDGIDEKILNFTEEQYPFEMNDQDILNSVFDCKVKFLEYKWNVSKQKWYVKNYKDIKLKNYYKNQYKKCKIYHFLGPNKPWQFINTLDYDYDHIESYWKYYKLTPFFKREDLKILKNIMRQKKYFSYHKIIEIKLFHKEIIKIFIQDYAINIHLLKKYEKKYKIKNEEGQ